MNRLKNSKTYSLNRNQCERSKQNFPSCKKRACALTRNTGERPRQKDRKSEREGGVFTHGCATPPVSGDLQERSCCSLSLARSLALSFSFIRVPFPLYFPRFITSQMNSFSLLFSRLAGESSVRPPNQSTACPKQAGGNSSKSHWMTN